MARARHPMRPPQLLRALDAAAEVMARLDIAILLLKEHAPLATATAPSSRWNSSIVCGTCWRPS